MTTSRYLSSVAAILLLPVTPSLVLAQTTPRVGVGIRSSTLGIGVEAAVAVAPRINVRVGFNGLNLSDVFEVDDDDILYSGTIRLRSGHASVDFYPTQGGFRISPGLLFANGNRATLRGFVPTGEYFGLGSETYQSGATPIEAVAELRFANVRPMITLGWGNLIPRSRRWSIPVELGIVISADPRSSYDYAGTVCDFNGGNCRDIRMDSALQADLRAEEATLNSDIRPLRFYPVLSIGFGFRF